MKRLNFIFKNRQTRQEQTLFWGGGGGKRVDIRVGECNALISLSFSRTDTFLGGGGGVKRVDIRVRGCNA